eukprot:5981916-Pleurochrysis_carterae.AAC.1
MGGHGAGSSARNIGTYPLQRTWGVRAFFAIFGLLSVGESRTAAVRYNKLLVVQGNPPRFRFASNDRTNKSIPIHIRPYMYNHADVSNNISRQHGYAIRKSKPNT